MSDQLGGEGRRVHDPRPVPAARRASGAALYLYAGDEAPRNAKVEGVSIAGLAPARGRAEAASRAGVAHRRADRRHLRRRPHASTSTPRGRARRRLRRLGRGGRWRLGLRPAPDVGGGHRRWRPPRRGHGRPVRGCRPTLDELEQRHRARLRSRATSSSATATPCRRRRAGTRGRRAAPPQALLERRFLHGGSQKLPTEVQAARRLRRGGRPGARGVRRARDVRAGDARARRAAGGRATAAVRARDSRWRPRTASWSPGWTESCCSRPSTPVMRTIGREPEDARLRRTTWQAARRPRQGRGRDRPRRARASASPRSPYSREPPGGSC